MPLSVKDGMGAWIKDFQDSNAPQFKGKSEKERREMAIAAYLDAKRSSRKESVKIETNTNHISTEIDKYVVEHKVNGKRYVVHEEQLDRMCMVGYEIVEKYKNPPFTPDPPGKKKPTKNSDGSATSPMSRVRQLAKMARDRAMKKEDVELDEKIDKDFFHTSVEKGKFMKSKYGRGDHKNTMFLHDLDHTGEPRLATFKHQDHAEKAAKRHGGKIVKSGMGTFRITKESVELDEAKYSWNDVNDALKKANYMRGNPAHIDRVASKFKYKSGNDKNFTHQDVKKNLSAAGIDGARHHDIMKHMKEGVELDEAMTTAIEFPNYFDLSKAEQDKIVKMTKKYKVQTPIEKRGRRNVIIADGPKSEMQKLERDLKRAGVKFVATESVEHIEEAKDMYKSAAQELKTYADKRGGMDKKDFHTAAKHIENIGRANLMSKGQHLAQLSKHLRNLDTSPREKVLSVLHKHGHKVGDFMPGAKMRRESVEQLDELSPATHKSYQAKAYSDAAKGMAKKRMGTMSSKDAYDNEKKRYKGIDTSKYLNRKQHGIKDGVEEATYGTQAQRIMSPLQKARQDKEKRDRDRDGKLKSTALPMRKKNEETVEAKSYDQKFRDHLKFSMSKSPAVQAHLKKRKDDRDAAHAKQDPAAVKKNYGPAVIPPGTAYNKARKRMDPSAAANAVSNTFKNRAKGRKLPEEKIDEAVQFKVDIEGLPPTFMQGKSSAEILGKLRKIVKQPSMIKDVERYTDMEVKKAYRQKAQGRPVDEAKYADPEDNMPPSEDEGKMAIKQAKFIQYVGKELEQYVKNNKEFPEWMQNKISAFHQKSKDVHSILGGDYGDDEQNESTQAYGDTMRKQQRDRQQKMMKSGEMDKLQKMRAMLDKEKKK